MVYNVGTVYRNWKIAGTVRKTMFILKNIDLARHIYIDIDIHIDIDIDISFTCTGFSIYDASYKLIDIDNMTHNIVIYCLYLKSLILHCL